MALPTSNNVVYASSTHVSKETWGKIFFDDSLVDGLFGGGSRVRLIVGHSFFVDDLPQFVDCMLGYNAVRGYLCTGKLACKRGWEREGPAFLYF